MRAKSERKKGMLNKRSTYEKPNKNRYINNDFNIETPSTLGSAFATKEVKK